MRFLLPFAACLTACQEVTLKEWTAAENAGFQVGLHMGAAAVSSDVALCETSAWTRIEDGLNWWTNNDTLYFDLREEYDPGLVGAPVESGFFAGFRVYYTDPSLGLGPAFRSSGCCDLYDPVPDYCR